MNETEWRWNRTRQRWELVTTDRDVDVAKGCLFDAAWIAMPWPLAVVIAPIAFIMWIIRVLRHRRLRA